MLALAYLESKKMIVSGSAEQVTGKEGKTITVKGKLTLYGSMLNDVICEADLAQPVTSILIITD